MIVLEEQCFLVTLSFNISTLIKIAFLKKTATTFYHYSGLTAGSIPLLIVSYCAKFLSAVFSKLFHYIWDR